MGAEVSNQAVGNCGPLIALAGINQLALLPQLFRKVSIPAVVYQELTSSLRFAATRHVFNPAILIMGKSLGKPLKRLDRSGGVVHPTEVGC